MTQQESFKRRIRARMAKTGERYLAARRALIEKAGGERRRPWVSEPETSDEAVRAATGRGWDDWCDLIDAWPGRADGHSAIAAYLQDHLDVDGWWAQSVTVGYERITGRRLPHQRPDGTFTAGKSRTIAVNGDVLRKMLLDDQLRADLFPGKQTELRSKPTSKVPRVAIGPGTAQIAIEPRRDGRTKVVISHERLPTLDDVAEWRFYWSEWLDAIDES